MDIKLLQQAAGCEGEKISVVIPCYNRQGYIGRCLDSILNQTFPLELMEIIVVDDKSTDDTLHILRSYEERYPDNILLIECEEQSGGYIGKVRNIGMSYASGAFVYFVDSDDVVKEDYIEKLYVQARLHTADIVECNYCMVDDGNVIGASVKSDCMYITTENDGFAALVLNDGLDGWVWGKCYRMAFLRANGISFPEDLHVAEDTYFHTQSIMSADRLISISDALYYYSFNPVGAWNSGKALSHVSECLEAQCRLYPLYIKNMSRAKLQIEWMVYGAVFGMKRKCEELGGASVFLQLLPKIRCELNEKFPSLQDNELIYTDKSEFNKELQRELFG